MTAVPPPVAKVFNWFREIMKVYNIGYELRVYAIIICINAEVVYGWSSFFKGLLDTAL
jgi:hypothetical protein